MSTINEGFVFTVTFSGARYSGNIPLLFLHNLYGRKPSAVSTTDGADSSPSRSFSNTTTEGREGGFRLQYTWSSLTTSYCIGFNALAADASRNSIYDSTVEKRIELMIQNYHDVSVTRTVTSGGHRYTVVFESPTGLNPRELVMIQTHSECDSFVATPNFSIDKDGDGLGAYPTNYFTLAFDTSSLIFGNSSFCALCTLPRGRHSTNPIDWEETDMSQSTSIQSRLNALPNLDDVTVSMSGPFINNEGYYFYITFGSSLDSSSASLGDIPLLTLHTDNLGGISTTDYVTSSNRFHMYESTRGRYPAYRLVYENIVGDCLPYDAPASGATNAIQESLIRMSTINNATVTRKK